MGLWRCCLLGLILLPAPLAAKSEVVGLASGPKDGVYHRLAEGVQRRLGEQGIEVRIDPKPDCAESLDWLEAKEEEEDAPVRFALAQQDIVAERFRRSPGTPIRVVDRVAFDYLHLFVRESLAIETVADLAGRRIWAGEAGSAVRFTATHFLDSIGTQIEKLLTYEDLKKIPWNAGDLHVEDYAVQELPNWLREGQLDAAMLVAPVGSPGVAETMRHCRCRLVPLDPRTRRKLQPEVRKSDPFLRHIALGAIPERTYDYQGGEISTVAVPVLLLAREETDSELAAVMRSAAQEEWRSMLADLKRRRGWRRSVSAPEVKALADSGLRLLPGVEREDPLSREWSPLWVHGLLALFLLGGGVALLRRRRLRRLALSLWYHYPLLFSIFPPLLLGVPLITWLAYLAERDVNEHFSSFWESGWSITVYIFSGLEDRVPYTLMGHILVTAGLFLGWICSAVATGWTAGVFVRRKKNMPRSLEDHFLFLNWNERGTDIVRELHHEVLRRRNRTSPIVVLTSEDSPGLKQLTQLDNGREEAFDQVYSCFGDPTDEAALKQANAKSARTVVILADEKHGDARTIRSILGLRKIAEEAGRSNLHVVAELIDPANDKVLKHLADGFPGRLESVSGPRLRTCLLSQAALIEGITKFYTDLLSVKDKTNEVYAELIPASAVGMTFRDYAALVVRTSHPASPLIPVGVQRKVGDKEDVYTNPKHGEEGAILAEGDKLILIAYGPPDENALPIPERTSVTDGRSAPPTVARVELSFSDHS